LLTRAEPLKTVINDSSGDISRKLPFFLLLRAVLQATDKNTSSLQRISMMEAHGENIKSAEALTIADSIFIFIFVVLFVLVIIDVLTPTFRFLFEPTVYGQSLYSLASGVLILFYGMFWGFSKIADEMGMIKSYESRWRLFVSKAFSFIGLARTDKKDILYVVLSVFVGIAFNVLTLYVMSLLVGGSILVRAPPSEIYLIVQYLIAAPLFEELVFRGIYLSSFLKILGNSYPSATLGLILSSFTFGWIHPGSLLSLLLKTSGGLFLGTIYIIKWRKNFVASFSTHFGFNLASIFLYVGNINTPMN